jgi:hypothetical protein
MDFQFQIDEQKIKEEIENAVLKAVRSYVKEEKRTLRYTVKDTIQKMVDDEIAKEFDVLDILQKSHEEIDQLKSTTRSKIIETRDHINKRLDEIKAEIGKWSPNSELERNVDIMLSWAIYRKLGIKPEDMKDQKPPHIVED